MKVLLVEDSRPLASMVTRALSSKGHQVVHAPNGLEGVKMFETGTFDLVLMDLDMPVMDGLHATTHIRAIETTREWAWTPIVFLTASDSTNNLVTAIKAGADDFLSKAVPIEVIIAKMEAMGRIAALRQQLEASNRRLRELSSRDGLTGILNRRAMDQRMNELWAEATQNETSFGLVMIDIDYFKKYNDHYGHLSGDDALKSVASFIDTAITAATGAGYIDDTSFVARYGGEEFAIVLPGATRDITDIIAAATVLKVREQAIPHAKNPEGFITISAGCAWTEKAGGKLNVLFREADTALYRAKEEGRNRRQWLQVPPLKV